MWVKTIRQISLAVLLSTISFTMAAHNKVVVVPLGEEEASAPTSKIVFVTSGLWNGDLKTAGMGSTGIEGADNLCMNSANAPDSLVQGKTFRAWLSDGTPPLFNGVDRRVGRIDLPYVNVLGDLIFSGLGSLLMAPANIILTETGGVATDEGARNWTAIFKTSEVSPRNCSAWSAVEADTFDGEHGIGGNVNANIGSQFGGGAWTDLRVFSCQTEHSLLCFEQ